MPVLLATASSDDEVRKVPNARIPWLAASSATTFTASARRSADMFAVLSKYDRGAADGLSYPLSGAGRGWKRGLEDCKRANRIALSSVERRSLSSSELVNNLATALPTVTRTETRVSYCNTF